MKKKGNLDVKNTKELINDWLNNRKQWVEQTLDVIDPQTKLIISDSVQLS